MKRWHTNRVPSTVAAKLVVLLLPALVMSLWLGASLLRTPDWKTTALPQSITARPLILNASTSTQASFRLASLLTPAANQPPPKSDPPKKEEEEEKDERAGRSGFLITRT